MAINVLAYSLWGNTHIYRNNFIKNYGLWKRSGIDREMWVYHDHTVPRSFRAKHSLARWIEMPKSHLRSGSYWRYIAIDEADNVWCRDNDSVFDAERNKYIADQWEATHKRLGIFRAHEFMYGLQKTRLYIRGGSFNIKGCTHGRMLELLQKYQGKYWAYPYGMDEFFLGRYIYPYFKNDCVVFIRSPVWQNLKEDLALSNHLHDNLVYRVINYPKDDCVGRNMLVAHARPLIVQRFNIYRYFIGYRIRRLFNIVFHGADQMAEEGRYYRIGTDPWRVFFVAYFLHRVIWAIRTRLYLLFGGIDGLVKNASRHQIAQNAHVPLVVTVYVGSDNIAFAHLSIYSILNQRLKPDKIIVYLSPDLLITSELKCLEARGVCFEKVSKPYSRRDVLLKAVMMRPKSLCAYADGSVFYTHTWLNDLYEAWRIRPESLCAIRANVLSKHSPKLNGKYYYQLSEHDYEDENLLEAFVPILAYGLLFPPGTDKHHICQDKAFRSIDGSDDVWCKSLISGLGIPLQIVPKKPSSLTYVNGVLQKYSNKQYLGHEGLADLLDYPHSHI